MRPNSSGLVNHKKVHRIEERMRIIGITGGIGGGKSEVMDYIASHYDAAVIKADLVGHLLMEPGQVCYHAVIQLLGRGIIASNQELDRSKIAAIVYRDKLLLEHLNEMIHPAVKAYILQKIEQYKAEGKAYFFIEAALLLEDSYDQVCNEVWYIYAHPDVRSRRLQKSRGYSQKKIDQIMANQLADEVFMQRCDVKIDNSNGWEDTKRQIDSRMQRLKEQF